MCSSVRVRERFASARSEIVSQARDRDAQPGLKMMVYEVSRSSEDERTSL